MAFIIKDSDKFFIGCFGKASENQFTFLATNCEKFFLEKFSLETLLERTEIMNESLRFKEKKVVKTILEDAPVSSEISASSEGLKINLTFDVNNRHLRLNFVLHECEDVGQMFTVGLIRLAVENSLMLNKLRKAVEAKDAEIDEYKRNGASLVRDSLATKKFEFEEESALSKIKFSNGQLTLDIAPLLKESNIPDLCSIIKAENILGPKKEDMPSQRTRAQQNTQSRAKTSSRIPVVPKVFEKKPLEYVNDDEAEDQQAAEQSAKATKKPRMIQKPKVYL